MIMADAACPNAADRLPTPAERPDSDVVIYDGHCRICTAQVRKLPWWDCQKKLSYLSLHDPEVARRWPDLSHDRMMQEMVIVDHNGNRHWGAEAIRYLIAPAATLVVGIAVSALPGQHAAVAAGVSVDRAQPLPPQRRAAVRRRHVLAAPLGAVTTPPWRAFPSRQTSDQELGWTFPSRTLDQEW